MDSDDETVYQYYTVVSNTDAFLSDSHDENTTPLTFIKQTDPTKIMYLSLGPMKGDEETEDVFEVDSILQTGIPDGEEDEEYDSSCGTNSKDAKMILNGEQVYLTSVSDIDENFGEVEENSDLDSLEFAEQSVPSLESLPEDKARLLESNYKKVQLEDGSVSYIYIGKSTWQMLVKSKPDGSKNRASKKERKFPCTYPGCGKEYTTAHHLTVHERTHTGARPYLCTMDNCGKSFATGYSLKAHHRIHTGDAPYECAVCPKKFKTSGDLQKHTRTHTGEKPFKCPMDGCGRAFTTSNTRKVHIRSHTGERPYACPYAKCGKAFASATNYKNHMRIHYGEKPYQCQVSGCGKRFTEYSSLFKHKAVHRAECKLLMCDICQRQFKYESALKTHELTVHKNTSK